MLTETVAGRTYDYSYNVGRNAQSGMGFQGPLSMAQGVDGVVYVVNRGAETIGNVDWNRTGFGQRISRMKLGRASGEEEYLGEFSRYGDGDGQLIWPAGIAADKNGLVYVTDEWLNRVSVFDKDGNYLRHWSTVQPGDEDPNGSCRIAISGEGTIYITDGRSHKVRRFKTDGTFLGTWGTKGSGDGQFDSPWGITIGPDEKIYVADSNNHRVQKFTPDGNFETKFGGPGTKRGDLYYPSDVAVDPDGDVYVCDWSKNRWGLGRVHIFNADGEFLTSLSGDAQQLSSWAQQTVDANDDYAKRRREVRSTEPEWTFAQPTGVEFDSENQRLIVTDTQRSRLQIYNKKTGYLVPQMNL